MGWYRTIFGRIEPVEVEKFTDSSVWIAGRRHGRMTGYEKHFPSWDEAHAFLHLEQESIVAGLRRRLESENGKLGNIKGMKPPVRA